jgi:hypothetical protein
VVTALGSVGGEATKAWLLRRDVPYEVIVVGVFLGVQLGGVVGRAGRALAWLGADRTGHAERLDVALRRFYRREWRSFLVSAAFHFVGWLIGAVEAFLILAALGLPASLVVATVIEALGSGVRFATFFLPASLGAFEGANAGAFGAFGWAVSAGLAFSVVRRARQAVWIGVA